MREICIGHISPRSQNERGATMIEYILVTAILVFALLTINETLMKAAETRGDRAANVVSNMAPCGDNLSQTNNQCY